MKQRHQSLITAGSTREAIDNVRYWANIFTGNTGLDIALAMLEIGNVTLLTSNRMHWDQFGPHGLQHDNRLTLIPFASYDELEAALELTMRTQHHTAVFMTAAVSDYRPNGAYRIESSRPIPGYDPPRYEWIVQDVQKPKVGGEHCRIAFEGLRTPKLVDKFRTDWKYRGLLFKFKLEAGISQAELIARSKLSRIQSQADVIVANTLEMVHGPNSAAYIIDQHTNVRVPRSDLAVKLREYILNHASNRSEE